MSALDALDALLTVAPSSSLAADAAASAAVAGMIDMMDLLGTGTAVLGGGSSSSRPAPAAPVVSHHVDDVAQCSLDLCNAISRPWTVCSYKGRSAQQRPGENSS